MSARRLAVLVSCEHGGNRVPTPWRGRFRGAEAVLDSHRGWDPGALPLARWLARALGAPLHAATVTRLLVDLNRSPHNPRVFSEYTRTLPAEVRRDLLAHHHGPYRREVEQAVASRVEEGATVLHLGIHSFTPALDGKPRRPELALLYDPARPAEAALSGAWARGLRARLPHRPVHRNDPYRGAADGLTTWLRRRHPAGSYLGIEVEVNQRLLDPRGRFPAEVGRALQASLVDALEELGWPHPRTGAY